MISLCSDGHETVAYEEDHCPVCHQRHLLQEIESEMSTLLALKAALEEQVNELKLVIEDLRNKIANLKGLNEDRLR